MNEGNGNENPRLHESQKEYAVARVQLVTKMRPFWGGGVFIREFKCFRAFLVCSVRIKTKREGLTSLATRVQFFTHRDSSTSFHKDICRPCFATMTEVNHTQDAQKDLETEGKNPFKRLPRSIVPSNYKLCLTPDLDKFTFKGNEEVTLEVS